jgi:hypothetical protein
MKLIIAALALTFAVAASAAPVQHHATPATKAACCACACCTSSCTQQTCCCKGGCCSTMGKARCASFWRSRIGHDAPLVAAKSGGCCK